MALENENVFVISLTNGHLDIDFCFGPEVHQRLIIAVLCIKRPRNVNGML